MKDINIPLKWYSHSYPVNEALRSGGCGERDIQTEGEGRKRENGLGVGRRRHICTEKERDRERAGERVRGGVAGGEREMQRRGASTNLRQNLKLLWILYCASLSRVLL